MKHGLVLCLLCLSVFISNSLAVPEIVVEPPEFEEDLITGDLEIFVLNIANDSEEGDLEWRLEIEILEEPEENLQDGWISVNPVEGFLEPGMDRDLDCHLNAFRLWGGDYVALIHFISNDPNHPVVDIRITLHITPAPDIHIMWPENAGWPDRLDFNSAFNGDVWVGVPCEIDIEITNVGVETLIIERIESHNDNFTLGEFDNEREPDQSTNLTVSFLSDEVAAYNGTLSFISNDPTNEEVIVRMQAVTWEPPVMRLNTHRIEFDLDNMQEAQSAVQISNDGVSHLRWNAELVQTGGTPYDPTSMEISIIPNFGSIQEQYSQSVSVNVNFINDISVNQQFDLIIHSNDPYLLKDTIEIEIDRYQGAKAEKLFVPTEVTLSPIYPNPFNSTATIEFGLPVQAEVTLSLFDIQGRKQTELFYGIKTAGFHSVSYIADNLSNGIYVVHLKASNANRFEKIILMK